MPTLAESRTSFSRYAGAGNSFTDRLNLVIARLLPEGNWKGTKIPVRFVVYTDSYGNAVVTLARGLETILAGAYQATSPNGNPPGTIWCGYPLPVRNAWYEFAATGPGLWNGSDGLRGLIPLEGRYTTFADWSTPKKLRIKLEQNEVAGTIIFRGTLAGAKLYSTDAPDWIEGIGLDYSNATVTTTQTFDAPPYQIIKPVTYGRISLFTVDTDGTETAVGLYDPDETNPSYSRWKVPMCTI